MKNHALIVQLETRFLDLADAAVAQGQAAYMKNRFPFFGIQKPIRTAVEKACFAQFPLQTEKELIEIIEQLWQKPQRELHYAALELAQKHHKLWTPALFFLFDYLIRTHSWWDSVDTIASQLIGRLLLKHPSLKVQMDRWIQDDNLWIRRTALIYQLRYKAETEHVKLFAYCAHTMHEQEFFIRKAIGWALREYSKTDAARVKEFVQQNKQNLSPLSLREASKYI